MYLALRLPQAESGALEWVQPHAAMRVALVLYGKVGTWTLPSSGTNLVGVTGGQEGALSLLTQARRTFEARVCSAPTPCNPVHLACSHVHPACTPHVPGARAAHQPSRALRGLRALVEPARG